MLPQVKYVRSVAASCSASLLGHDSPWISYVLHSLASEQSVYLNSLYREAVAYIPWKWPSPSHPPLSFSLEAGISWCISSLYQLVSFNVRIPLLRCNPLHERENAGPSSCCPGGLGNPWKVVLWMMLLVVPLNQGSGIFCQYMNMKQWQAILLACEQGQVSPLHSFWPNVHKELQTLCLWAPGNRHELRPGGQM